MMKTEFSMPEMMMPSAVWELWLAPVRALNWQQDQLEALGTSWASQLHTMRHDGQRVLEAMAAEGKTQCDAATKTFQGMFQTPAAV